MILPPALWEGMLVLAVLIGLVGVVIMFSAMEFGRRTLLFGAWVLGFALLLGFAFGFGTSYVDYDDGEMVCIENAAGGQCTYPDAEPCSYYNDRSKEACHEKWTHGGGG